MSYDYDRSKNVELSVYDGIPHLLSPVVTDPTKAVTALKWAVREMENRYRNMAKMGSGILALQRTAGSSTGKR